MTPSVSIIVPSYRSNATIGRCIESLLAQDYDGTYEVIVSASADDPTELPVAPDDPRVRLITHVPRMRAAAARNRAVAEARGPLLVFADADVVARPDWLRRLVDSSDGGRRCVAGGVLNGTPDSAAGTVEYLVEFFDLHPRRPAETAWHGATCNLLVPRLVWDDLGPFPEDMGGGEDTLLTVRARESGRFVFAGDAQVTHLNRTTWREVFGHHVQIGRFAAHIARRSSYKARPLVRYTPLAPVAAVGRVVSLYARVAAWDRRMLPRALVLCPAIVIVLAGFGVGLALEGARIDREARRGRKVTRPADRRLAPERRP